MPARRFRAVLERLWAASPYFAFVLVERNAGCAPLHGSDGLTFQVFNC